MDWCAQAWEKVLFHKNNWPRSLDMKSMRSKLAANLSSIAKENPNLTALLKTKWRYFTHMAIWQTPSREAAETYSVLSIIPIT
jgi:hypothetical protein